MLTALLFSFSFAAAGDAVYVVAGTQVVLDFAQKQELSSAVAAGFPGIPPATLDQYYCFANPPDVPDPNAIDLQALAASLKWSCRAADSNPTATDEIALNYEILGGQCKIVDRTDGKSFLLCTSPQMNTDGRILNDAFTQSVFTRVLNLTWDFRCVRNPADDTEITCGFNPVKIASPAVWRADRKAGLVLKTIGRVAP